MSASLSPPSPPGARLLGHALAFRRDPLALLERAAALGPVAELRLAGQRMWLVTTPELVEEVLITRARQLGKSRLLRVLGRLVLGDALDTLDGEAWSTRMRLVAPAFRKPRLDALLALIRDHGDILGAQSTLDDEALLGLSLMLQLRLFLGVNLTDVAPLGVAIRAALAGWNARVRFGLPTPDWLPAPHNLAMRRAMRPLRALVAGAIAARRTQPSAGEGDDLLAALLPTGLDDATLTNELTTMVFLGAHQVALALGWTLQSLAEHSCQQSRIAAEAERSLEPARLPFTAMVLEESLRLHPPFFLLVREALVDGELGGHRLRRGTSVACSPWVMGRSARYFDAPSEFRPERWADPRLARLPRGAHFPLGGGPRSCIANALVRTQLTILIAALLRRATLALTSPPRPPRPGVTLAFTPPLRLTMTPRASDAAVEAAS